MAVTKIQFKQGEALTFRFNVKDKNTKAAIDLSTAAGFTFAMKQSKHASTFVYSTVDFDVSSASSGIIACSMNETATNIAPGLYYGELYMAIAANNVRKSQDIIFDVERAVNP